MACEKMAEELTASNNGLWKKHKLKSALRFRLRALKKVKEKDKGKKRNSKKFSADQILCEIGHLVTVFWSFDFMEYKLENVLKETDRW